MAWFLTLSHGRDKVRVMGTMVAQGGVVPVRMSVPPPVAGDAAGREDAAPFGRGGVEVGRVMEPEVSMMDATVMLGVRRAGR